MILMLNDFNKQNILYITKYLYITDLEQKTVLFTYIKPHNIS